MLRMDDVLSRLAKQADTFTRTIGQAQVRTRAVGRKLRGVEQIDAIQAENLLELAGVTTAADLDEIEAESEV
jgi:DNA recombination protein RmuC